jgi:hypothetical protein
MHGSGRMNCLNPINAELLADYWLGALAASDEESIEEHLFACDGCSRRLEEAVALANGIRNVARHGNLLRVVDDEFLKRAASENLRIREYAPPRGGSVQCTVAAEDDLLIGRLTADLSSAKRLDLSLYGGDGNERVRLDDIPFRPNADSICFQQPIDYAKAAPSDVMIARLLATDGSGEQRLIGEYTFVHTRTIPGPAAW